MKTRIYPAALLIAVALLPGRARAKDFCLAGARYSYAIAMQRDQGVEMGKEIENIYQIQREAGWSPSREDITQTVTSIYSNPRTPTQIEADFMNWCREHHPEEMSK
jgi:hypothetical protein